MAAVNWFCLLLVLAFAFINGYVCIKVDPNIPNGNYTTISLNSQQTTILPYKVNDDNEPDNITLLGGADTELSASERTRRLIPYMAFYVPVSQLPINKQYAISSNNHNHNNIHMTKQQPQQALIRPASATGVGSGGSGPTGPTDSTHIPIPPQYVHNTGVGLQYLPAAGQTHSVVSGQNYQPNAGLGYYQTNNEGSGSGSSSGYVGGGHIQSQAQYHLLPPTTTGHSQYLQPPGPPGPSVLGLPAGPVTNKANGNQAFVNFKELKGPIRHKTVQHFPPLSATASSATSASASLSVLKQQQQQQQQLKSLGGGTAGIAASAAGVYRPRTKQQSKINLTPFTPANSVPGNFVPIVYTPVNTNNNHNNNILHSPTSQAKGIAAIDDTQLFNHNENQQQQQQQQQYHKQTPIEYSSGPLPPTAPATAISVPIHVPSSVAQRQHPHHHHHNPTPVKQQQQSQYFSVTTSPLSPVNVDLTHDVGAAVANSGETGGDIQHPHAHHHHLHQNTPAISPLPTTAIYHQNPQQQQQQQQQNHQQQAEHVIIDEAHQQPQTVTLIGSKQQQTQQQQQQQQFYHDKSVVQFQPPKPESFFESEIHIRQQQQLQQQQHRHHHQNHQSIDQVLKDVNSYSIKSSHVMTPQEKYVMYLQQRMNYNKQQQQQQQQQHYATRQKYREHKHQEREQQQQQQQFINKQHQNPTQIFVLSSTISPSLDTPAIVAVPSAAAAVPIRPSSPPPPPLLSPPSPVQHHYDSNYPQHSPIHHDLYPKANPNTGASGGGSGVNGGGVVGSGAGTGSGRQEHILTIPVHSLFGELETLQKQSHYSQTHSALPSPSTSHNNNKPYPKIGPSTPQYIDHIIEEPKQSLDDEHHQVAVQSHRNNQHSQHRQQQPHNQLELLKPTLGPPSHAFILVTTAAPYPQDPVTQENYGSSARPLYKSKPKIRLQPVLKENNVNYPAIRQQHHPATGRPLVVAITPTPKTIINNHQPGEEDLSPKYVYVNEEFGQKIPTVQGAVKLKPSNKYESDDNQISHQQHQHAPLHAPTHNAVNVDPTTLPPPPSPSPPKTVYADPNELPDIRTSSLAEILHKLQESNHLPHTLTPDNIDNSIKTLIRILNNLKQTQTIVANPPQHHETPTHHSHPSSPDYDYSTGSEEEEHQKQQQQHVEQQPQDIHILAPTGPNKHPGPSTGRPGVDYPNYAEIPETSFDCSQQRYKGFFGDPETNCQVWHYCDLNGGKASFLCPNGTIFSQIALTCDWWFNVKCATTAQLYVLNERLYKYILPFTPKFPEDYSGPLVDKYLAMKFQEMEEKMRLEKEKALREESEEAAAATEQEQPDTTVTEENKEENHLDETTTEDNVHRQIKSHSTVIPVSHKHESVNSQVSEQSSERNLLIDDEVNDISQRGKPDDFESTTISTMTATIKSDAISFSLKPIIVSSTLGPDYDEESVQHLDNKRSYNSDNTTKEITVTKTENETDTIDKEIKVSSSTERTSENQMQISVEKVDVIEIKPDGATGHLIRDMLTYSKHNK